jgi:hypothetical protein
MRKQLCACGCGELVTQKVEMQHISALAPALLTSQVLDQNQRLIQWKKRSQAIGFSTPLHWQLVMGNTSKINDVYGQSRSGPSQCIAPHAGPLGLSHDDSLSPDPFYNCEDILMDHPAPSISPLLNDDGEVYGLSNLCQSQQIAEKIGQQQWGSDAPVHFVNNGEESDEEEEEDLDMGDEPISDSDIASDKEEDDEMFAEPGQESISLWDSIGEGFLREVSQLGMLFWYHYYSHYLKKISTPVLEGKLLDEADLTLICAYSFKVNHGLTRDAYTSL